MFTGIIEDIGEVTRLTRRAEALALEVSSGLPAESIQLGDSLAVNGVCLTVTRMDGRNLTFDVSHQTLESSTLKQLKPKSRVHLERALALGGRLGGHLVTGHVDGVGQLTARVPRGENLDLTIQAPDGFTPYLVPKGSVAVDGVSLTINQPTGSIFSVTLVPHTLAKTRLSDLRPGDSLNLEADIIGKYVRHFNKQPGGSGIDEQFLAEHGFLGGKERA